MHYVPQPIASSCFNRLHHHDHSQNAPGSPRSQQRPHPTPDGGVALSCSNRWSPRRFRCRYCICGHLRAQHAGAAQLLNPDSKARFLQRCKTDVAEMRSIFSTGGYGALRAARVGRSGQEWGWSLLCVSTSVHIHSWSHSWWYQWPIATVKSQATRRPSRALRVAVAPRLGEASSPSANHRRMPLRSPGKIAEWHLLVDIRIEHPATQRDSEGAVTKGKHFVASWVACM